MRSIAFLLITVTFAVGQDCVWGSFDATRINYAEGTLDGSAHTVLVGIIQANGGTIASSTSTLNETYLGGVDVFYTSLLNTSTGTLSPAEQTALQSWIASGGVLIVTGDIFPLAAYESFTSFYGVTGYTAISGSGIGYPVGSHPLTAGVSSYYFMTECTFSYGSDALLIGNNGSGSDFLIVMEEGTGFTAGGRILVLGDHNMFTNSYINSEDNAVLAANIALWTSSTTSLDHDTWGGIKAVF
ncbi:MAG: hypothetical protein AVO35_02525 [Candidatus Aegiribacteria sp. MLS_C]|nr:MAG: hypothetical protein AVO35_02525 [Candidatus Aegiribacteria sp. MLS_C]